MSTILSDAQAWVSIQQHIERIIKERARLQDELDELYQQQGMISELLYDARKKANKDMIAVHVDEGIVLVEHNRDGLSVSLVTLYE